MSKSRQPDAIREDRREFLKGLAVTGAAVGLGAAAGNAVAGVADTPETPVKQGKQGYRETAHVRDYYRSAEV